MAPNYDEVLDLVDQTFKKATNNSLTALNIAGLSVVCKYLEIPFRHSICSKLEMNFPQEMKPGQWAPFIARRLNAKCYINPIGGAKLFNLSDFINYGVDLKFARFGDFTYSTPGYAFLPDLSILDVLMWVHPQKVRDAAFSLIELLSFDKVNPPANQD
jgi:hypothetical protein